MGEINSKRPLVYTCLGSKESERKWYRSGLENSVMALNTFYEATKLPFFASLDEAWNIKIESVIRNIEITGRFEL